jgi:hypothetical protein
MYFDRDRGTVCCVIGSCKVVCLRNRICTAGLPVPVRLLSTIREGGRRNERDAPDSEIDAICISASIDGFRKSCFADSLLQYCTFEYCSKLDRFGAGSLIGTRLECLCLPASISTFDGSECAVPSDLILTLENDHRFFRISDGLLIATGIRAAVRQFGRKKEIVISNEIEVISGRCFEAPIDAKDYSERVRFASVSKIVQIGARAFQNCRGLTAICVPASVKCLGTYAFWQCWRLQELTFEPNSGLEVIETYCFASCYALREIILPASLRILETIGPLCFSSCRALANVGFESGCNLRSIERQAFDDCVGLTSVRLPYSVEFLGTLCFNQCVNLSQIEFESGSKLRGIGLNCFSGCRALARFQVPRSIEKLGVQWFEYCTALKSLTFDPAIRVPEIPRGLLGSNRTLASICIPPSTRVLCSFCFSHWSQLSSVTFERPSKIGRIESSAFSWCDSLRYLVLPGSIESIGAHAFYACPSLEEVIVEGRGSIRNIDRNAFQLCPRLTPDAFRGLAGCFCPFNLTRSCPFRLGECEYDDLIGYDQALADLMLRFFAGSPAG